MADFRMDLSIVIVSYNSAPVILNCITSIAASIQVIEYEIICVDNQSTDNTVEQLKEKFPKIITVINARNHGFAAANNQGANLARGEYLLFLNPDTIIHGLAIEKAIQFMKTNLQVGVLGAKLLNEDGSIQSSCGSFPSLWSYFLESTFLYHLCNKTRLFRNGLPITYKYDRPLIVDIVKGAFFLVRKMDFDEIGGFDENYFMYSEEDDFCYRTYRRGRKTIIVPEVEVLHYGGKSSDPIWDKMFVEQHKSKIIYFLKHKGKLKAFMAAVLLFTGVIMRLFIWTLLVTAALVALHRKKVYFRTKFKNYLAAFFWYVEDGFRNILVS